jgi:putative transposase
MKYNPDIPGRRSLRLKDYDYTQPGGYFITVCTRDRECLLGEVRDGEMIPNDLGKIVLQVWNELPAHYPHVELDAFCLMPNHFHGIVILTNMVDPNVGAGLRPTPTNRPASTNRLAPGKGGAQATRDRLRR